MNNPQREVKHMLKQQYGRDGHIGIVLRAILRGLHGGVIPDLNRGSLSKNVSESRWGCNYSEIGKKYLE